jgi:hypothetical protein
VLRHVQYSAENEKIFEVVKNAHENALIRENIVLSRGETWRLLSQLMKMVLKEMLEKLDGRSGPS